jgi:hypothetical protein
MHEIFQEYEESMLSSILKRPLPFGVLEDALTVERSVRLRLKDVHGIKAFLSGWPREISGRGYICTEEDYPVPGNSAFDTIACLLVKVEGYDNGLVQAGCDTQEQVKFL